MQLASMEQEIHVEVKVLPSNLSWILSVVYASPRIVKGKCYGKILLKLLSFIVNLG